MQPGFQSLVLYRSFECTEDDYAPSISHWEGGVNAPISSANSKGDGLGGHPLLRRVQFRTSLPWKAQLASLLRNRPADESLRFCASRRPSHPETESPECR